MPNWEANCGAKVWRRVLKISEGQKQFMKLNPAQWPITQQLFIFCSNVAGGPNSTTSTLKAARAALMLIPILGIHFILLPIRPEQGSTLEYVYEVVSAVSSSYQVKAMSDIFYSPIKWVAVWNTELVSIYFGFGLYFCHEITINAGHT